MNTVVNMTKAQWIALLVSYGESILAAAAALYLAGVTDPLDLLWSLVAAVVPVLTRAINPNDKAFGRIPDPEDVDEALRNAEPQEYPYREEDNS